MSSPAVSQAQAGSQSPLGAGRVARGFIVRSVSARARTRCLPRLQRWSHSTGCWSQVGSGPNLMCAYVQGYKKPSHP